MMVKIWRNKGFHEFILEHIAKAEQHLRHQGWLDAVTGGPNVDLIQAKLGPQEAYLPPEVNQALYYADWQGAAYECLGNLPAALAWYQLGQYLWRGGKQFANVTEAVPATGTRDAAARNQLPAAICADRVGKRARAADLYRWAAENRTWTEDEMAFFVEEKQHQPVWQWLPDRAYALACLEDWPEALAVAEEAHRWAQEDQRAQTSESYQLPLHLIPRILALARYKLDPSAENLLQARAVFDLRSVKSRSHPDQLLIFFHLFNLRARFGSKIL